MKIWTDTKTCDSCSVFKHVLPRVKKRLSLGNKEENNTEKDKNTENSAKFILI